ncbi:MAG: flagellar protein FlgN [Limnobacter sp.]|nr:flagellar protein FlgN [Limnobacter sp.]
MSPTTQAQTLLQELAKDCEKAMQLVDILFDEQASLLKMHTDRLGELAVQKESMMFELEKRFKEHLGQAVKAGQPDTLAGLETWIDKLTIHAPTLASTFETLRSSLEQAKRLNKTNGELVSEQLASLKDRIAILTAASIESGNAKPADTYGPKGGLGNSAGSKPRAVIR